MTRAKRIRTANWTLRALSVVTLMELVVAPACMPLCAAQNCQSVQTRFAPAGKCHGGGAPVKAPLMHAFRACGSAEMPAVVLSRTSFEETSGMSPLSTADGKFVADERHTSEPASTFS